VHLIGFGVFVRICFVFRFGLSQNELGCASEYCNFLIEDLMLDLNGDVWGISNVSKCDWRWLLNPNG
jgi:hypothetical protein